MILIGYFLLIIFKKILRLSDGILRSEDAISSILLGLITLILYSYLINYIILPTTIHRYVFILLVFSSLVFLLRTVSCRNSRVYIDIPLRKFIPLFIISYSTIMVIYFYHTLSNFVLPYWDGLFNHGKGAVIAVSGFYINDPSFFYWLLAELYQLAQCATTNVYVLSGILHWIPLTVLLLSLIDLTKGEIKLIVIGFLTSLTGTYMTYYGLIHGIVPDFNNMASYVNKMLINIGPFTSGVLFPSYSSPRTICGVSGLLATIYSFILFLRGGSFHDMIRSTLLFSLAVVLITLGYPLYLIPVTISFLLFSFFASLHLRNFNPETSKRIFILNEVQALVISFSLTITWLRTGIYQNILFWLVTSLPPLLLLIICYSGLIMRRMRKIEVGFSTNVIRARIIIKVKPDIFRFNTSEIKAIITALFLLLIAILVSSIIFIFTPRVSFQWQVHKWSTYTFVSPKYEWYVYLAAYAPILIPSFLALLTIFLKALGSRANKISLLELMFASSFVICFLPASMIISEVFGVYYSNRTITEWILSSMVYFLVILMTIASRILKKIRALMILFLFLISLAIPGTIYYSHYIATYNPLFNKLKNDDIMLLERLRQLSYDGKISIVLPLSEDLEYLANYLAAVPTYTVATRKFIVEQIIQERDFLNIISLLERYQTNTLLAWKDAELLALFQKQCHSNCTIFMSSNLALILIQTIPQKPRENKLFVVEHSELWAIKI